MKVKYFLIMLLYAVLIYSCKKESNNGSSSQIDEVDIYTAGYEFNGSVSVATYWKNGIATRLSDGTHASEARSIVVSGNNVYVAGVENNNAVYWKNGTLVNLINNPATYYRLSWADGIAVSGDDVYVAGTVNGFFPGTNSLGLVAKYWKNGVPVNLTSEYFGSQTSSITVSGNDIYLTGSAWEPYPLDSIGVPCSRIRCQHYEEATYWKNGAPIYVTDGTITQAHATGIAVSGTDIYVCGDIIYDATTTLGGQAAYWKNGSWVKLAYSGTDAVRVSGIAVSGNDVYVSGTGYVNGGFSKALYWKNGVAIPLQGIGEQVSGTATAIAVNGSDVYVAGNLFYLSTPALPLPRVAVKCWKNNNMTAVPIDSTKLPIVKSIFVVKK